MQVVFTQYASETRPEGFLQEGRDYTDHQVELDDESAILLLGQLRPARSAMHVKAENCSLSFILDPGTAIQVEIMSFVDAFWAISEVTESEAGSIIRVAYRGEQFGEIIPGTDRIWDAYSD